MTITYKTNAATTTKSMTEWFFGKEVVEKKWSGISPHPPCG